VLYACAQPAYTRWPEEFPAIQAGLLEAAARAEATYVSMENVYGYGPVDGPLTEDLPLVATDRKGEVRARMAQEVLDAHAAGRVRTTAGRASDFYGPHVEASAVGERFFPRILAGRSVQVVGDPDQPHTFTSIGDIGRALVTLGSDDRAWGRAWHLPNAPTVSVRAFADLAAAQAGTGPAKVTSVPGVVLAVLSRFIPDLREVREMLHEWDRPFVVDASAYAETFGDDWTPLADGLDATLAWYRERATA
jgi:nucleoside-diphosphate-sugar epimerase